MKFRDWFFQATGAAWVDFRRANPTCPGPGYRACWKAAIERGPARVDYKIALDQLTNELLELAKLAVKQNDIIGLKIFLERIDTAKFVVDGSIPLTAEEEASARSAYLASKETLPPEPGPLPRSSRPGPGASEIETPLVPQPPPLASTPPGAVSDS